MLTVLKICVVFFKFGIFSYGGGLAILALLKDEAIKLGWITTDDFVNMIAISQSTPGPIAINMATFVGFFEGGILGSFGASIAVITPGFIMSLILAKFLIHFDEKPIVQSALKGIRVTVIGLIGVAIFEIGKLSILNRDVNTYSTLFEYVDLRSVVLLGLLVFFVFKYNKHPVYYIIPAGIIGMIVF